jgi:DNA repair exonuclease SbcCD ATPase subunit
MCAEVCAMTGVVSNQVGPRLLARLAVLLLFGMTAAPWVVLAQSEPGGTGELRTADEEFSKQLGELKNTFSDLSKKFEDSAQTIDRLNSAEAARQEIEELRDAVGQLLGAVADNGAVWSLGVKALSHAEAKLKSLEQETRYKQEDKQFLLERWRDLKVATEGAIRELESARKDFAELLRKLQTSEDFIDELLQIREHQRALDVIHKLTDGIRDASDKLKKLLGTIKTPGA